jgi:hypothetical protein
MLTYPRSGSTSASAHDVAGRQVSAWRDRRGARSSRRPRGAANLNALLVKGSIGTNPRQSAKPDGARSARGRPRRLDQIARLTEPAPGLIEPPGARPRRHMGTRVEELDLPEVDILGVDRAEALTALRQAARQHWLARTPLGYAVTRYDDVVAILRDRSSRSGQSTSSAFSTTSWAATCHSSPGRRTSSTPTCGPWSSGVGAPGRRSAQRAHPGRGAGRPAVH